MLAPGTRLGSFEIGAPLGAGGMGEVYRARDTRLGREVALKVLPAERMADEGRRRRFVQEAKAASALNHPNIVTVHEIGSADGVDFIVMELVPGQSLASLIPRSGMAVQQALRIALAIADALSAAHARGIVHRDVKPANVVVTPGGVVKVLDFGLAKLTAGEPGDSSEALNTLTSPEPLSEPGAITGTAAYMSPEQATGGSVDTRSDIFSFGVVLYQLVTGQRPFGEATASELRAAVVRDQPRPPRELAPGLPEALERVVLRCLRKEPERRFQHMGDVKLELEELLEASSTGTAAVAGAPSSPARARRRRVASALVGLAVLAIGAVAWQSRRQESPAPSPSLIQLSTERWAGGGSFSPDGTQIAYSSAGDDAANWDIWLKLVGDPEGRRLTTDPATENSPAWSPDGSEIAFVRLRPGARRGVISSQLDAGTIHVVSPLGGTARRLSDLPVHGRPSWSPDGRWLAAAGARSGSEPPGGIYLVSAATGESRPLTRPEPPAFDLSPAFAPDGRAIAYAACTGPETSPSCNIHILSLAAGLEPTGSARVLERQGQSSHGLCWTRDGRSIVYGADAFLWRVRVDDQTTPERLELAGFAIAPATVGARDRLAFVRLTGDVDVYRLEAGGAPRALAQSTLLERQASFSPDGRRIAFQAGEPARGFDIWLADADGSNPTRLTRGPERLKGSPSWSPDGRSLAFDARGEDGQRDVWTIGVDGSGLRRVTESAANDYAPSWSRDGRFLYITSDRTGRAEVYRVPAGGGPEEQLTHAGGTQPVESLDGRELFYQRSQDGALLVRTAAGGEREARPCVRSRAWAVAPHGVVYQRCEGTTEADQPGLFLRFWDARSGADRPWGSVDADGIDGMSVSPDGRSVLFGRGRELSSLMMIESFR